MFGQCLITEGQWFFTCWNHCLFVPAFKSITHLRVLSLKDDAEHGKKYSDHKTQLHTDQSRGRHGDQPHRGVGAAGTPLGRYVPELPQRPTEAYNDDAGENALLEGVEARRKEEKDE